MKTYSQANSAKPYPDRFEDLSFDDWINLHESEPAQFEKCRLKLLNDLVDSAPERSKPRLKGLIFQMDAESRRAKSQMAYNIRLSSMMMETLGELNYRLNELIGSKSLNIVQNQLPVETATVLPFIRNTIIDQE